MSNNLVDNPVGIDAVIEQLQKPLFDKMVSLDPNFKGFGRVFKNKKDKQYILEFFKTNGDYEDVLGGEDCRFFFYLNDDLEGNTDVTAKVDIIFIVNLDLMFNSNQRRDEELRAIIANTIEPTRFRLKKILLGLDYVKRIVSDPFSDVNFQFNDMHPHHVVTFKTEVQYKLKTC